MTTSAGRPAVREQLLATKLFVPPPERGAIERPRLVERLDGAVGYRLVLLAAPAGYGKSTLLSQWLDRSPLPGAWLSLDAGDNDPHRFWRYLLAALDTLHEGFSEAAQPSYGAPIGVLAEAALAAIINTFSAKPDHSVLVLDDYHLIETEVVHGGLAFLLEHLPPRLHLVVASRGEPPLPVASLRAKGRLLELTSGDLRFSASETGGFLDRVAGARLAPREVTTLENRTEGWITGLKLAALSLRGREDPASFVRTFAGSSRYVLDYLAEDVLGRQPAHVQDFLLQCSVLERFSAPLCEAVTGREDGREMVAGLARDDLFLVPLDDQAHWYRFHHLFADFLRSRLRQADADIVPVLHCRASGWFEAHGFVVEAVDHAFAAGDFERAARLIERFTKRGVVRHEVATVLGWLDTLPTDLVRARPLLGLAYAWALSSSGRLAEVEPHLQRLEDSIATAGDDGEPAPLRGHVAAIRALVDCFRGDPEASIAHSRTALELLSDDQLVLRGILANNIALNLQSASTSGVTVATACEVLEEAARLSRAGGDIAGAITSLVFLGNTEAARGRLRRARDVYGQVLRLADEHGLATPTVGVAFVGLGGIDYEWNQLAEAEAHLLRGTELLTGYWGDVGALPLACLLLAQLHGLRGDGAGSLAWLDRAETSARKPAISWLISRVAAQRAYLALQRGDLSEAGRWARESGLGPRDALGYRREGEYAVLARVLLAQGRLDEAATLLDWLGRVTQEAGLTRSAAEVTLLEALVHQQKGDEEAAIEATGRALTLAEPEGYVRLFVDEGEGVAALLRGVARRGRSLGTIARLLDAFAAHERAPAARAVDGGSLPLHVDSLSERELEVLRLVAVGLSNKQAAKQLGVAPGTIKKHLYNLNGKLGVSSRTEAIARARELGFLNDA